MPAAASVTATSDAPIQVQPYFLFETNAPHADQRDLKWVEAYREAFERAVKVRARSHYLIGAESSGGIDSSAIASYFATILPHAPEDFHCFGWCTLEQEPEYLLLTAAERNFRNTHIAAGQNLGKWGADQQAMQDCVGYPVEHEMILDQVSMLSLSKTLGIRSILSGFGGDECATSFAAHTRWDYWNRGAYGLILRELPGLLPMRIARLGKAFLRPPASPVEREHGFLKGSLNTAPFREGVVEQQRLPSIIEDYLAPLRKAETQSEAIAASVYFNTAAMARLESYNLVGQHFNIEFRWPLLDRRLVQLVLKTPAIELRRKTVGRYLHRRAVEDLVPERINWKDNKYLGEILPGVDLLIDHPVPTTDDIPDILHDLLDVQVLQKEWSRLLALRASGEVTHADISSSFMIARIIRALSWLNG